MKAPDESSIKKDFPEKATEWIAADGKRCTDGTKVVPTELARRGRAQYLEEREVY